MGGGSCTEVGSIRVNGWCREAPGVVKLGGTWKAWRTVRLTQPAGAALVWLASPARAGAAASACVCVSVSERAGCARRCFLAYRRCFVRLLLFG